MSAVRCIALALSLFLSLAVGRMANAEEVWQAGVAKAVITPPELMWMSGYGSRDRPADGSIHDLWAKAVVVQDPQGHSIVLMTLDLVGIDRGTSEAICQKIQQAHGLQRAQISLATSHTHSGPVVGTNLITMYGFDERQHHLVRQYTALLIDKVAGVVDSAFSTLAPARITTGEGHCGFAVNRRNNREADVPALRAAGQLQGPVDHAAPVLAVRTPEGQLRAVVFGYACHATVLSLYQWSGDWPGFAQIELEQRHPDAVALFWAGCGADQNPLPRRTVEVAQAYGRQIADAVDEVLNGPMDAVRGTLRTDYREIDLKLAELPSREQIEQEAASDNVYLVRRARRLLQTLDQQGSLSPAYPYPIQVWGIGEQVSMVFLGGEVVVDFSLRLKSELPGPQTWVASYSNDVMAYIPSARVLQEGGYEGATSMIYYGLPTVWSGEVEEHIVQSVREAQAAVQATAAVADK